MKVLVLAEVFPPRMGGSGRFLWELYRRMPKEAVHVAAGDVEGSGDFDATQTFGVTRLPLRFPQWGLRRGYRHYARALSQVRRLASQSEAEVIHCAKAVPEGAIAWLLQKWNRGPYLCFVHGEELTLAQTSRELHAITARVLRRAQRLLANSVHTQRLLTGDWQVPVERIEVLHPGVDCRRYVPAARNRETRERLGWGARPVVLTVGALQKRKGQDTMIKALPAVRRIIPDVLYVIAGEGWERDYLQGLVGELGLEGAVQFRGAPTDDEVIECYQQADLFVLPNRRVGWDFEGFGIVLLEAQASACPVIAGASGGTAEAVDAPRTGLVIPCETAEPLADAVVQLLADRQRGSLMGARGCEWVRTHFDWSLVSLRAARLFGLDEVQ
jgi:phosphatidylinositol alpha-1,6-mannosyltransferase